MARLDRERKCPVWRGHPRQYQVRAQAVYAEDMRRAILPWSWVTTTCDEPMCLDSEHMRLHQPLKIKYAVGVCVYCGYPAGTIDHLLPEPTTGKTLRGMVAIVPACGDCNSRIGAFPEHNVGERRRRAQNSIERKNKTLLEGQDKTPEELRELGHMMRHVAQVNAIKRAAVRERLAWPLDPFYDLRAFQKSGIDDPVALGLCDEWATALRPEFAA